MREPWLDWVQRLHSIGQAGLTYSTDPYDRERFEQLRELTYEMAAHQIQRPIDDCRRLFGDEVGYQTPKVDIRGVVFDRDRLLMVRERQDGLWSVPGGWADVGHSPSEIAVKEIAEEAGLETRPVRLLGVLDKGRHDHPPSAHYTYKIFIECELMGGTPQGGMETFAAAFFAEDGVPPLSLSRITTAQVAWLFRAHEHPYQLARVD
jgi:ADP-ribose pyrophosphatase YjhB (NUDIX family)